MSNTKQSVIPIQRGHTHSFVLKSIRTDFLQMMFDVISKACRRSIQIRVLCFKSPMGQLLEGQFEISVCKGRLQCCFLLAGGSNKLPALCTAHNKKMTKQNQMLSIVMFSMSIHPSIFTPLSCSGSELGYSESELDLLTVHARNTQRID